MWEPAAKSHGLGGPSLEGGVGIIEISRAGAADASLPGPFAS